MTEYDDRRPTTGGLTAAIVASAAVGVLAVGAALYGPPGLGALGFGTAEPTPSGASAPAASAPAYATEEYGRRLLAHTAELLGQDQPNPGLRYINSRLNCGSCHLATGTEPGTLTLLQTDEHYPRFSGRAGGMTDIEDRINECMQRSMNGRTLSMDSPEMFAMASYLRSLGSQYQAMGASGLKAKEPAPFKTPVRAADVAKGQLVYSTRCGICHGSDGLGLLATEDPGQGYLFPPLWGSDSFNNGAGMHRVLTAARFIKARMPLGEATLTDGEAFDVAAFINSKPRPEMTDLERDYPDKSAKPIDNPYGPYADDFPLEQHRFGPFQQIDEYYKALKKK
ncbi:MAG TPA: c-type cytochrome [Vicinamibacterales bacterium]|nr:c-type cytochrome [Vicinamibacterales bacterium]